MLTNLYCNFSTFLGRGWVAGGGGDCGVVDVLFGFRPGCYGLMFEI